MTGMHPTELVQRLHSYDLSTLLGLRALIRSDEPLAWRSLGELAAAVHAEFSRLADRADSPVHTLSPPWEAQSTDAGLASYLDAHVVRRLEAECVIERSVHVDQDAAPEPGATTRELRLNIDGQALGQGGREEILHGIDGRLRQIGRETHEAPAAPPPEPVEEPRSDGGTLAARGLVKIYKKRRVVNDVDIHVSQGEIVGLLGPNGAGKTTTFYMIVGLIPPDAGRVFLSGEEVTSVAMYRRARRGVGYLSQEPSVFRRLTVEENVLAILQMMKLPKREQKARLEMLLDELGIKHLRKSKAYALSGGERRRLEITRALVGEPKFMLLDEPFAGVDPIAVHDIQQIVADLRRRHIGVLISDHNVEQTLDIVDRAYIMYDGRVRVSGTVSELVWNDEVAEIYLGPTLTARMRQRYPRPESLQLS